MRKYLNNIYIRKEILKIFIKKVIFILFYNIKMKKHEEFNELIRNWKEELKTNLKKNNYNSTIALYLIPRKWEIAKNKYFTDKIKEDLRSFSNDIFNYDNNIINPEKDFFIIKQSYINTKLPAIEAKAHYSKNKLLMALGDSFYFYYFYYLDKNDNICEGYIEQIAQDKDENFENEFYNNTIQDFYTSFLKSKKQTKVNNTIIYDLTNYKIVFKNEKNFNKFNQSIERNNNIKKEDNVTKKISNRSNWGSRFGNNNINNNINNNNINNKKDNQYKDKIKEEDKKKLIKKIKETNLKQKGNNNNKPYTQNKNNKNNIKHLEKKGKEIIKKESGFIKKSKNKIDKPNLKIEEKDIKDNLSDNKEKPSDHIEKEQEEEEEIQTNEEIKGLIGLQNVGATCYMNATLQCFSNIPKLRYYFLSNKLNINEDKKNIISSSLLKIFENLWENNKISYYIPKEFKDTISVLNPLFAGIQANDSKDLILFILESIHKELNEIKNIPNENNINNPHDYNSVFNNFSVFYAQNYNSIISNLFYGMNNAMMSCCNCGITTHNVQVFNILFFPLEEVRKYKGYTQNKVNIYDCFDYNQKEEYMIGSNQIYCNNCNQFANAKNQSTIIISPNVLIINLNRGRGLMYDVKIEFPEFLEIQKYVYYQQSPNFYELIGVISHFGTSDMGGHFIAYCKNSENCKWYKYNDASVSESSFEESMNNGVPYVLFYNYIKKS